MMLVDMLGRLRGYNARLNIDVVMKRCTVLRGE